MKVKENLEHILKELQDATFKIEEEQIENVLIRSHRRLKMTSVQTDFPLAVSNVSLHYFLWSHLEV